MPYPYMSEAAKVRDLPNVMKYIRGAIIDVGCGHDKITTNAVGFDGRTFDGVNVKKEGLYIDEVACCDTIFSSHFLEHTPNPYAYVMDWHYSLVTGGHLVLYLPDKKHYDNYGNLEHLQNWSYEDFMFWFSRSFCGEGKNYKGEYLPKLFQLVESGMDVGQDKYSFFVIARSV